MATESEMADTNGSTATTPLPVLLVFCTGNPWVWVITMGNPRVCLNYGNKYILLILNNLIIKEQSNNLRMEGGRVYEGGGEV